MALAQSAPKPSCTIREPPHDCLVLIIDTTVTATGTHETHLPGTFHVTPHELTLSPPLPNYPTIQLSNYPLLSYETRKLWKDVRFEFGSPVHTI